MNRLCVSCFDSTVHPTRAGLGYSTCLPCGEVAARAVKHTIAPLNKSNYILVTDPQLLKQLNPKRVQTS